MNRFFIAFNFFGIIMLAVLCTIQWHVNSLATAHANSLQTTVEQQQTKLNDDAKVIENYTADLQDMHQRLELSEKQLKDLDEKLTQEIRERNTIAGERDELKIALGKWTAAVAERDKTIKLANEDIRRRADDHNDLVQKINILTEKYNSLVKQWNDQQTRH